MTFSGNIDVYHVKCRFCMRTPMIFESEMWILLWSLESVLDNLCRRLWKNGL